MSFHINSDKEKIRGVNPKLIGDNETTIRVGSGADEREIMRLELDTQSGLPRVGINRTGQRVNNIDVTAGGSGYTLAPTVVIDAPPSGGTQALASAFIFNGAVVSVAVNDPGNGYTTAPNVAFTGGNGAGAGATAVLDTVDFELDINGAIRTSTSIISDTARILNLDIENFVTPDLNLRAPNLKTFMNATGTPWSSNVIVSKGSYRYSQGNVYQAMNTGTTGSGIPTHKDGIVLNGEVNFKHIGFRVNDVNDYEYLNTGEAGVFPRSITPILGDRSDKIATTEYVLNLATNDVGGRVYVSAQIGSDLNDGRSAVNPVRTIKKAAQIAWSTPGIKETLIVSGGDYVEDNPISLPPDCSVVGDNLRLVIVRPSNLGKHLFKFGDKNYVTGVTYRDKIDSNGDSIGTWDYAMVFDDKQRITIDNETNGDASVEFPIGHQIFGPERFRIGFQNNTGLSLLQSGVEAVGLNTGARTLIADVSFTTTTGASAYVSGTIDVQLKSGSLIEGDQYSYITSASVGSTSSLTISGTSGENTLRFTNDPTSEIPVNAVVFLDDTDNSSFTSGYYQVTSIDTSNAPTYWDVQFIPILGAPSWDTTQSETIVMSSATATSNTIDTINLKSIRAEGEVVSYDEDVTSTLPISRIDFSLQGDASIATGGFQQAQFGSAEDIGGIVFYTSALVGRTNFHEFKEGQEIIISGMPTVSPDLSFLNGKQRIYKVLEDADGRARRFVIPKKLPTLTTSNFDPGEFATVQSYSKTVTLSLLNSPNKFPLATPVERRYQDASLLIRNNREYIAEEVLGRINREFAKDYFAVYNINTSNNTFDIYLGTTDHVNTYVSGGTVTFGGTSYAISDFAYDHIGGVATVTTTFAAVSALSEDDIVKLADILISCSAGQKVYPAYSAPTSGINTGDDSDEQCKQDVIHFLNALVRDLEFGTNHNVIEGSKKYIVDGKITYIEDEIIQNVRAIEYARELAIYAMCNWRIKNRTPSDPLYTTKYATSTRYTDETIINTTAGNPRCDDVRAAIDTLSYLWVDVISNNANGTYLDAAYLIARNADVIADQALIDTEAAYPTLDLSDLHQRKCRRDIKIVLEGLIRDLVLGGNHGIVSTAEAYFSGTVLSGITEAQRAETLYAFERVKLYSIQAMRNWSDGNVLLTTPTGSTYVPATGALTVVIPDPAVLPVANSDRIAFSEEALTFSCAYGGGGTDAGPYRTDIAFGKSFLISNVVSSGGSTTISCNVGAAGSNTDTHTFDSALANGTKLIYGPVTLTSPIPKYEDWSILTGGGAAPIGIFTPTNVTYDPTSGDLTFTTATAHNLTTSNTIRFQPESLVFTCDMDNDATEHRYPQNGQPAYGNNLVITGTTSNTVTVNVGAVGTNAQFTPTAGSYDPASGIMTLEIGAHTLDVGEGVVIADNSLSFKCAMDGNTAVKTYPRPSIDRVSGRSIPIAGKTATTISVNVGKSPADRTFQAGSSTAYDPVTGDLIIDVGTQHGIGVGRNIVLEDGAITFTCNLDGNATNHSYPRSTDPASGTSLEVTDVTTSSHTVTNAPYDAATGIITFTLGTHGFTTGDYIKIDDDALTYKCELDGNTTNHAYPRAGFDYASNRWLPITKIDDNTFSVDVGVASSSDQYDHTFVSAAANGIKRQEGLIVVNVGTTPLVNFTPTGATYNTTSGDLVLTIGANHGLTAGTSIKLATDSLTFECPAAVGTHLFVSGTPGGITPNAGSAVTAAAGTTYNPTTGDMVIEIGSHSLTTSNTVAIANGAVTFTCDADNHGTNHAYPRATDPVSGNNAIPITAVGATTITVNVGVASSNSQSTYPRATGAATGSGADYAYNTALPITSADQAAGTITINVNGGQGAISVGSAHTFISATAGAVISGGNYAHTFVSGLANGVKFTPQSAHTFVSATTNAISHTPNSPHAFVRSNTDSISAYSTSAGSICATVESSVNTSLELFADILDGTIFAGATTQTYGTLYDTTPIITYPDSYITDFYNQRIAVRGTYDDYPIIEASPYTQNSSVISFRGGGGALVDGSKVKQPNCPFAGLEPDGTASFPNQGKSMVASAFTIVSFGGTGYKIINDGYVQLVSVFVIFCQDGVLAESGGYASITNSATNFGTYALRGRGYREECYEFDVGTVNVVSQTPTGRTTLTVGGIGREPLEHYIVKIDGYTNADPTKEFFIDSVSGVTVGPPFSATLIIDDGVGNGLSLIETATGNTVTGLTALQQALTPAAASNATIKLHRPSIVNSSSHTWEFAGSGNNYLALPENGGTKVEANEQVSEDYGRVYVSGTDELGDFKVGTFARIENRTGNITFTGTVTISEVEFLKLKGGDVVVTGFDASNTLGGANASDSKLPTQKAVKDYITNNLGPYINKPYSTNAVPRALVELTDSGKISIDQIPALRPFQVFTVATQADRLKIEGALAGDIAIQQDTSQSFILNDDLDSLFLGFAVDASLVFNVNDVYTGSPSTGRIQATEYREGVVYQINITNGGSGYTVAPTVTISGGNPSAGATAATAVATIANGEVVTITITENATFLGGKGYTTQPVVTIQAPPGAGTQATATALIESRLYGDIVNQIKMLDTDTFDDSDSPSANTINISRVVNTSSTDINNWVSLSSNQIAASDITSGVIETDRLATGGAANSFTFLRGDQNWAAAVQSVKGAETRYFARLYSQASIGSSSFIFVTNTNALIGHEVVANVAGIAANTNINGVTTTGGLTTVSLNNPVTATIAAGTVIEFERGDSPLTFDSSNTIGNFIDSVVIANPGTGYTDGQYFDISLDGGAGNDLRANIIISGGAVTDATVTNAGSGYTADFQVTPNPSAIGSGSNLVLLAKVSTVNKQFANVAVDIQRVSDLTISADDFGTIGVARYRKSQFNIGQEGNGSISIKMGPDSGLDADLLDGQQGQYYLNGAFFVDSSIVPDKLASGVYSIDITGRSTNTLRVETGINNPTSNPAPSDSVQGLTLQTVFNSSNGLLTAFPSVDTGTSNSAKHLVMTLRNGETGIDATFGGVRQLAFANDDRIYLRGSGDGVTSYGSWYEIWNSGNQGIDSGLDADKLDNKEGVWYQDGWNIKENEIFDTRLPVWRSSTKFRNKIEIKSYTGTDVSYRILVRQVLDINPGGDFEPGSQINIYNVNKQDIGDFFIDNVQQLNDQNDSANSYTMLIGRLASGGNLETAVFLGVAGDERNFENYEIYDSNTTQYAEIGNDSGNGFVRLGRYDGNAATNPYIYFNSSQAQAVDNNGDPSYNSAIIADGGNATEGSGSLEFKVVNENELKVNNNIIWNAGNVAFNSANVASTASLKSAVMRDTNGDFAAGTITASIVGASSLNVLKSGDTMTGGLTITGNNNINIQGTGGLSVGGNTTITADLTVDTNTLYVDSTDNRVAINNLDPQTKLHIIGTGWEDNTVGSDLLRLEATGNIGAGFALKNADAEYWNIYAGGSSAWVGQGNLGFVYGDGTNEATDYKIAFTTGGNILPGDDSAQDFGADATRWQNSYVDISHVLNSVRIAKGTANQEADIHLRGGGTGNGGGRGFRLGSNIGGGADVFEIYSSQTNGQDDWKSLASGEPALAIQGANNRVGINTNTFSGTDTTVSPNVSRDYILNVSGDMNIDGQLFQNNAEFVTSRWTESTNDSGANIYRNSKVGIGNVPSPGYQLDVAGDTNIAGVFYLNSNRLYADTQGIIALAASTISEDVDIPANSIASSNGPLELASGNTITINSGATWTIG